MDGPWWWEDEPGDGARASGMITAGPERTAVVIAPKDAPEANLSYIASVGPSVMLARIVTERKLLLLHRPQWSESPHIDSDFYGCLTCMESGLCGTIKLLLALYADRPGYREEWRP